MALIRIIGQQQGMMVFEYKCERCGEVSRIAVRPQSVEFGIAVLGEKGKDVETPVIVKSGFKPRQVA